MQLGTLATSALRAVASLSSAGDEDARQALALMKGVPTFKQTLEAVLKEMEVEYYFLADEMDEKNPVLKDFVGEKLPGIEHESMPHDALKQLSAQAKFAIRTGEFSPYANVILRAGVVF